MGLVTNVTKRVEFPHEAGQHAVIKKLSHKQLRDAKKVQEAANVEGMRRFGADLMRVFLENNAKDAARKATEITEAQDAMASTYDRDSILDKGLVSWSYDVPPSQEGAIGNLDEETAKFLHEEIVGFSRGQHSDADRKNDSGGSIAS